MARWQPSGGGAFLADNHAGLSASAGALTPQEKLLASPLGLDPENDPVVFTTDYGLEIKWHMASPLPTDPSDLSTTTVSSTNWAYFEAGGLEWIIIGCSNKSTTFSTGTVNFGTASNYYNRSGYFNFSNSSSGIWQWFASETGTPAGSALFSDYLNIGKDVIYNSASQTITQKAVFTNAAATDELETNEVLCLLSGNYTTTSFGSSKVYYSSTGVSSNLRTYINDTIYPLVKDLPIEPQPLTTAGSAETTEYLFPLATTQLASTESFAVENYLDSDTKRGIGAEWWLRSQFSTATQYDLWVVGAGGGMGGHKWEGYTSGVRPAFVLKI